MKLQMYTKSTYVLSSIFFIPDYTVGTGFSPVQPYSIRNTVRGLYHRSGFTPCPWRRIIFYL